MEDWRRNRGEYRHRYQPPFKTSQYRKSDSMYAEIPAWVHSVPGWEKKFIIHVGKMPWGRFMHCQKVLDHDGSVFQWDDSAGREAFQNAKSRYWAEMKGLHRGSSLPDPDMYIQLIDWDANTDQELYDGLEVQLDVDDEEANADSMWNTDQPIVPTGWGDEEANWKGDDKKAAIEDNPWASNQDRWNGGGWGVNCLSSLMKPIIPSGCADGADCPSKTDKGNPSLQNDDKKVDNKIDPWEDKHAGWRDVEPWGQSSGTKNTTSSPWQNGRGGWEGVAPWGQSNGMKNKTSDSGNHNYSSNNANWRRGSEKWRKRESEDHHLSRYKTTRYNGEDYEPNNRWRNDRGNKRVSFAQEQSPVEPANSAQQWSSAAQQWNSFQNCGPISQHRPRGWEKNVSHRIN